MEKSPEGSGIVCGLELKRTGDKSVRIYAGFGYTSNGTRIEIGDSCEYVYYRHHKKEGSREAYMFDYFRGISEIFELLQTHQCGPENNDFNWIPRQKSSDTTYLDLNDKVIVLFKADKSDIRAFAIRRDELAAFLYGEIPWNDIDCDTRSGGENFSLWGKNKPNASASVSDICLYNYLYPIMLLPVIKVRRFGYGSIDFDDLGCDDNYKSLCDKDPYSHLDLVEEYQAIVDIALRQLNDAFQAFHGYKKTKKWIGQEAVEILDAQIYALNEKWEHYKKWPVINKNKGITGGDKSAIQYWYGFARDLADAWNELREAAVCYKGICEVNPDKYRNHLILGALPEERSPFFYEVFRTVFQQPSVKSAEAAALQRLRFLHWRLVMMIKSFFVPGSDWDDTASDSYLHTLANRNSDNPDEIATKINLPLRLTPGVTPDQPIGKRTIPFYFDLADHPQSLHGYWDYNAAFGNRAGYLLSYHSDNDVAHMKTAGYAGTRAHSYTTFPEAIHPFAFDMRGLSFIRIEGLTGQVFNNLPDIDARFTPLKKQYGIEFTLVVKKLGIDNLECQRGIDHLGGVYHRGEFIVLVAEQEDNPGWFRVVGDFTLFP